eukprot:2870391-Pyramimonas_sp.AAC.1
MPGLVHEAQSATTQKVVESKVPLRGVSMGKGVSRRPPARKPSDGRPNRGQTVTNNRKLHGVPPARPGSRRVPRQSVESTLGVNY